MSGVKEMPTKNRESLTRNKEILSLIDELSQSQESCGEQLKQGIKGCQDNELLVVGIKQADTNAPYRPSFTRHSTSINRGSYKYTRKGTTQVGRDRAESGANSLDDENSLQSE